MGCGSSVSYKNKVLPVLGPADKFAEPVVGSTQQEWDPHFLSREKELGEKTLELPDGRIVAYWCDGDPTKDIPVLAFHGGCMTKSYFLQRESIPGVCLVSVDRAGYGGSSSSPPSYSFKESVEDVIALLDHLGLTKFVVVGHSMGAMLSSQIAAALPERVLAAALYGCGSDPFHPDCPEAVKSAQVFPMCHPQTGCCGCLMQKNLGSTSESVARYDFTGFLKDEMKSGPTRYEEFKNDPFWVSATCRALHGGMATTKSLERMLGAPGQDCDFDLFWTKWHYDIATIKCPTYLIHGDGDHDIPVEVLEHNARLIPGAKVVMKQGCSHTLVTGSAPDFKEDLATLLGDIQ